MQKVEHYCLTIHIYIYIQETTGPYGSVHSLPYLGRWRSIKQRRSHKLISENLKVYCGTVGDIGAVDSRAK